MKNKNLILVLMLLASIIVACNSTDKNKTVMNSNPLLTEFDTPFGVPPFEQIKPEHFMPAFEYAMKIQNKNIQKIIDNQQKPDFYNTIESFENSGDLLMQVSRIFYNIKSAATNDELNNVAKQIAPLLSEHKDNIMMNSKLFEKIKAVYDNKDNFNLTIEQQTLLNNVYNNFIRGGANLEGNDKKRFSEINKELSLLSLQFGENVLAENNRYKLVIDDTTDLAGLPSGSVMAASKKADELGLNGKWVFTIHKPSLLPFLENAENRELRKQMYTAYIMKGDHNDSLDNKEVVNKIVNLRIERAHLLGYESHAAYILDRNMAKTPKNVYDLLNKLMPAALHVAKKEVTAMQKMIDTEGNKFKLQAWDYPYYAAKVKQQQYSLDENEIRPYLSLENVRNGMFEVAHRLYGITFTKLNDMPVYYPGIDVYEVKDTNNSHLGILYLDYYPRASKRSGAWCTSYREEKYDDGKRIAPVMSIVCNFTAPTDDTPALLTVDETKTLFHEFGHALDGLFSNKHYASLETPRDFVELPSQIMENWAFAPEVLKIYANHYKTGESIPNELIIKIQKAGRFNQGFATTEYLAASYLDMDYHTLTKKVDLDINKFEKESMERIHLIPEIDPRYRSTYFQHIFAGEYSAGYYSYVWAEVLDADAFEVFKEKGLFDKNTAIAFRKNILEMGGTKDAMELYRQFRGQDPDIQALINHRGLN